jgi:V8-like Glu-specific endopeptidase
LPKSWLAAESKLDLATPLNFCSTNDIIGGNSGSPVIDREAQIVGLIFDGNIHSLGGDYAYEPKDNRAVAVHSAALLEALRKIYGASRVADELKP